MNAKRTKAAILAAVITISSLSLTASALSSEFDYSFDLSVGETDVSQARKKSSFNYVTVKTTEGTVSSLHPVSLWVSPTTNIANKITDTKKLRLTIEVFPIMRTKYSLLHKAVTIQYP